MSSQAAGGCPPVIRPARPVPSTQRKTRLRASFLCVSPSAYGEIVVMEEPTQEYVVGWRKDRRHSRSILRLSAYADRQAAISSALALSCGYVPSVGRKRRRFRDANRSAVYIWERAFSGPKRPYGSIDEACDEARRITSLFGVAAVSVSLGSTRLASESYFMPSRGIVLAPSMLDEASLIHEVAHYLVWRMAVAEPSHGPAFIAVLTALYALLGIADVQVIIGLASKYHLEVNTPLLKGLLSFPCGKLAA
jgi:hypothetical protein